MVRRAAILIAACLVGAGPTAADEGAQSPRELIKAYEAEAQALSEAEGGARAAEQIGTLRAWLGEARSALLADEPEVLRQRLELARAQIRLVQANIDRSAVEAETLKVKDRATALSKSATELRNEAFRLEQRLTEIEAKAREAAATAPAPVGEDAPVIAPPPGGAP